MPEGDTTLQDIELSAREMRIGDNRLCLHTLSDAVRPNRVWMASKRFMNLR